MPRVDTPTNLLADQFRMARLQPRQGVSGAEHGSDLGPPVGASENPRSKLVGEGRGPRPSRSQDPAFSDERPPSQGARARVSGRRAADGLGGTARSRTTLPARDGDHNGAIS